MTMQIAVETQGAHVRSLDVYQRAVRNTFAFLKQTSRFDELLAKSISLPAARGFLVPVCELHTGDADLIALFSRWRRENSFAYPSQFSVTDCGTANWLRSRLLDCPDRILFLALDRLGHPVGHLGFANCLNDQAAMEVDNVVRGVKGTHPGFMSEAMCAMLRWAEETFGPRKIHLRVFSDNAHAIGFYRRLGFADDGLLPLRQRSEGETINYLPVEPGDNSPPDKYFLRLIYSARHRAGETMILTAGPSISAREAWYALDAVRTGWNHHWNGYIQRFESAFAEYVGAKYALSYSSCTGALHVALLALGIGAGDEVIVPDITWVATANAVVYVGATPVFADVNALTWCLDPASVEKLITARTKAVIPVHLYGHPAQMDRVMAIAAKHNLRVLEDAAPSVGAEFRGRRVGTFGDFAAFSFQGAKLLVTGEGGMLVTSNEDLHKRACAIWDQGRVPGTFWIERTGYKYKMSNLQAAVGLAQLERVDEFIEAKRRIFGWYCDGLEGTPGIRLNREAPWARSIYWMTSLLVEKRAGISAELLRSELRQRNIDTRPVFPAISKYPVWPTTPPPQPVASYVATHAINLPSGVCLKRVEVDYICKSIREILTR
jgi:perosamine synthetase